MEFHEASRLTPEGQQKVAFVDIDETICFYDEGKRRYDLAKPNYDNISKINKLSEDIEPFNCTKSSLFFNSKLDISIKSFFRINDPVPLSKPYSFQNPFPNFKLI